MIVSESPKIRMFNWECMKVLRTMDPKEYDLAIVDPPYGIGTDVIKNNKTRTKLAKAPKYHKFPNNKKHRPTEEYFELLKEVSENQIIWGANHLCDLFDASGTGWITWDKGTTGAFSDGELAYTSFRKSHQLFKYIWNGMIQGTHGDKKKNEVRIHPTQKPVALYKWLLTKYASHGQKILDTHGGSMSIAIACYELGFDLDVFEIDEKYYSDAVERFLNHKKQLSFNFGKKNSQSQLDLSGKVQA